MRLAAGTLAVLLSQSLAFAEDAAPNRVESVESRYEDASARPRAKVPIRVVRILRETGQALVFDRSAGTGGTHLLVGVGEKVAGYTVESIDDDEVTLSANGRQIVLAAPDQRWRRRGGRGGEVRDAARPAHGEPAPADPYGPVTGAVGAVIEEKAPVDPYGKPESKPEGSAPVDPYAKPEGSAPVDPYGEESRPLREVKAPSSAQPGGEAVRSTSAGGAGTGPGGPVAVPVVIGPSTPSPSPSPAPTMIGPAPAPAADPVLARREVDAALADFGALAVGFQASFTPAGVKVESVLESSLFAKAGLRAGDVIASVEGRPLRSLDDVAALYARAGTLRVVTAQVVRGGKPVSLRVTIQ